MGQQPIQEQFEHKCELFEIFDFWLIFEGTTTEVPKNAIFEVADLLPETAPDLSGYLLGAKMGQKTRFSG